MDWAAVMFKQSEVDPGSTAAPVPQVQVVPTPAAGKRGPVGTSPRTNYSRVNTGTPETPDAGAVAQKTMEPKVARAHNQLMSEVSMNTMAARPTLQQMLKNAMAGASVGSTKIAEEAKRQLENLEGESDKDKKEEKKDKKSDESEEKVSGAYARKLASAIEYCAELLVKTGADLAGPWNVTESKVEPGKGPGALQVMEAPSGPPPSDNVGKATAGNQPPKNPGLQRQLASGKDAPTQLENDINHRPGADAEASWAPDGDHSKLSMAQRIKAAAKRDREAPEGISPGTAGLAGAGLGLLTSNPISGGLGAYYGARRAQEAGMPTSEGAIRGGIGAGAGEWVGTLGGAGLGALGGAGLGALAGRPDIGAGVGALAGGLGGSIYGARKGYQMAMDDIPKQASVVQMIRKIAAQQKKAEDAINPARITAGAAQAPQTLEASDPGPGGEDKNLVPTTPQGVADFTRRQAKAPMKQEMRQYVDEPMMSESSDKVLANAFGHTDQAGAKISSAQEVSKVASARALMRRLAESAGVNPTTYR